ncbi:MAG: hypothetical protein ACAH17_03060 [Candidatus Paceibacterota bacterium]
MKRYFSLAVSKLNFWNLFIGLVIGFALGMIALEALVPDSTKLIRMYRLHDESLIKESLQIK